MAESSVKLPTVPKTQTHETEESADGDALLTGEGGKAAGTRAAAAGASTATATFSGSYSTGNPLEELMHAVSGNREKMTDQIEIQKEATKLNKFQAGHMKRLELKADAELLEAQKKAEDAKGGGFWRKLKSAFTGEIQRAQAAAKRAQAQAEFTRAAVAEVSAKQQKAQQVQELVGSKVKQAINDKKKNEDRFGDVVKNIDDVRADQAKALGGKSGQG